MILDSFMGTLNRAADDPSGLLMSLYPEFSRVLVGELSAYAEIVQRVAEMDPLTEFGYCKCCDMPMFVSAAAHTTDCPYIQARKLRGME